MITRELSCKEITRDPDQPRKDFDEVALKSLAASISSEGLLQPIIVYRNGDGYVIVDGERRFTAMQQAGKDSIAAIVLDEKPDEATILLIQLTTNCQRQDLNPLEKAQAYHRLMDHHGCSVTELAKVLHCSKSTVSQTLAYLRLPDEAQALLASGELAASTAYAIARESDEQKQRELIRRARQGDLKRDAVVRAIRRRPAEARNQRTVFRLEQVEVSLACVDKPALTDVVQYLRDLLRECRKAIRQGLDVSTFERVLADQHRTAE